MTRVIVYIFLLQLFAIPVATLAIDEHIVQIKEVSSSGKTVYIGSGTLSGMKRNDYAFLVQKKKIGENQFIFKPVAKLRVIKSTMIDSIWVVYKTFLPKQLKRDNKLYLFTESSLLRGRKDELTYSRKKVITTDKVKRDLRDSLKEDDTRLRRQTKQFSERVTTHKAEKHLEKDVEIFDVERFEKDAFENKKIAKSFYRSAKADEFEDARRVQTFEKMLVAFLNKYNNPSFDYDEFYAEQKRVKGLDEFQDKAVFESYTDLYDKRLAEKADRDQRFHEEVMKKGESWSDDYSDSELSELLTNISVIREKKRRELLLAYRYRYQIYFSAGMNLVSNNNSSDPTNVESNRYDLEFAWEGYVFKKFQELKKFTFEASIRRAKDSFSTGNFNAKSTELSFATHINWYPYWGPNVIERNIVYVGLLARFGVTTLTSGGDKGNYQLSSLPGLRAGVKYNFANSFGVRVTTSLENISVSRIVRSSNSGTLPDRANYIDGKVGFGISKFY